jgi:hypothetical protein
MIAYLLLVEHLDSRVTDVMIPLQMPWRITNEVMGSLLPEWANPCVILPPTLLFHASCGKNRCYSAKTVKMAVASAETVRSDMKRAFWVSGWQARAMGGRFSHGDKGRVGWRND